jgi:hypothetical protein
MKTIIQGKNLVTTYSVDHKWKQITDTKGDIKTVYAGKPELKKETVLDSWAVIKEYDEKVEFNIKPLGHIFTLNLCDPIGRINLSEDEEIVITEKIFRTDLGAYVLHTDKVLDEKVLYKEESEDILKSQIKEFNKQMIESDEKLLSYCNLHKLVLEDTDVDELFKLVYPDKIYRIEDVKLVAKGNDKFSVWYNSVRSSILDDEYMNNTLLTTTTTTNAR